MTVKELVEGYYAAWVFLALMLLMSNTFLMFWMIFNGWNMLWLVFSPLWIPVVSFIEFFIMGMVACAIFCQDQRR